MTTTTDPASPTVFVIDDDVYMRKVLERQLRATGYTVETFASPKAFLQRPHFDGQGCILLDIQMPGMTGIELQDELGKSEYVMPIIFLTACANLDICVKVMKKGAEDFLTKPFSEMQLLESVRVAINKDRASRLSYAERVQAAQLLATLSSRNRQVMDLLLAGKLNKQIAAELCVSEITVKVNRRQVMEKMGVTSLVDLMRIVTCTQAPDQARLRNATVGIGSKRPTQLQDRSQRKVAANQAIRDRLTAQTNIDATDLAKSSAKVGKHRTP